MAQIKIIIKKYWPLLVLLVWFGFIFTNLLLSHMLSPKQNGLYSGGSTWGDLALHLTLISNFSQSGLQLNNNPVFSNSDLSYSFLPDLISSWLVNLGFSIQSALIIPSLFFAMIGVVLLYLITLKITKSKVGAFLAPLIFFFNGTIFGMYYFWQDFKLSHFGFSKFLGSMTKSYSHLPDLNVRFSNILTDYILPQRAFIPGLVIGLLAIYFLWQYWDREQRRDLIYAGMALSFIPLFHVHSFVALVIVCLFLALIQLITGFTKQKFLDWIFFSIPLLIIALPQFLLIYPWDKGSFFRIQLGWMSHNLKDSISWFWLKNLTPHLFLFIIAWFFAGPKLKKFYLAFTALFVLTNIVIFQPHDYDNMKLMLWWFILSIILLANLFEFLITKWKGAGILLTILIFISLTITGAISVYRESYVSWLMFSSEDMALADYVKNNTQKDSVFLTSDAHNHPIPCLAGRKIVMGYRGWLWTHGINYRDREIDIMDIFKGSEESMHLIKKYQISYIVLDKFKQASFNMSDSFFNKNFPIVYKSSNYSVYRTN